MCGGEDGLAHLLDWLGKRSRVVAGLRAASWRTIDLARLYRRLPRRRAFPAPELGRLMDKAEHRQYQYRQPRQASLDDCRHQRAPALRQGDDRPFAARDADRQRKVHGVSAQSAHYPRRHHHRNSCRRARRPRQRAVHPARHRARILGRHCGGARCHAGRRPHRPVRGDGRRRHFRRRAGSSHGHSGAGRRRALRVRA